MHVYTYIQLACDAIVILCVVVDQYGIRVCLTNLISHMKYIGDPTRIIWIPWFAININELYERKRQ